MRNACFSKPNVSSTRNCRFGGSGVWKSVQDHRQNRIGNRMRFGIVFVWIWVEFGSHFGLQNRSKIDQKLNQSSESILKTKSWPQTGLYVFYHANCQNGCPGMLSERILRIKSTRGLSRVAGGWRPRRGSRDPKVANYLTKRSSTPCTCRQGRRIWRLRLCRQPLLLSRGW